MDTCQKPQNCSPIKPEEGIERKEQPQNNETSVTLDNFKGEPKNWEDPDLPQPSRIFLVRWNLAVRRFLRKCLCAQNRRGKILKIVFINAAALGLLVASILHHYKQDDPAIINWCNGVGCFWILYCVVYATFLLKLASRRAGPTFSDCLKPACDFFFQLGSKKAFRWTVYWIPFVSLGVFVLVCPGRSGRRKFSFLGMVVFLVLGYILSKYPAYVNWRPVICGMALQFLFGFFIIRLDMGRDFLDCIGRLVTRFLQYTDAGSNFVFSFLATQEENAHAPVFAFSVLPVIYFLSFTINILSYFGLLQWAIMTVSRVVRFLMGTTVCESVNATASIFLGMTEAPLLIQKYLKDLTKSELCAILCAGWSTVSGVVMAAYVQFGVKASHLIAASVMSAPASLAYSKLIYPETEKSKTTIHNIILHKEEGTNFLEAASRGAQTAVLITANIIANIIAILAFVAFIDGCLGWIGEVIGFEELSFKFLMSRIFYPISFLIGIDVESVEEVAYLIGIKTIANEFQAYQKLGELIRHNRISERSEIITTYVLCGFSNFGSIGITTGALSVIAPTRVAALAEVAMPAFIASNVVCFLTACVAGCLIE